MFKTSLLWEERLRRELEGSLWNLWDLESSVPAARTVPAPLGWVPGKLEGPLGTLALSSVGISEMAVKYLSPVVSQSYTGPVMWPSGKASVSQTAPNYFSRRGVKAIPTVGWAHWHLGASVLALKMIKQENAERCQQLGALESLDYANLSAAYCQGWGTGTCLLTRETS